MSDDAVEVERGEGWESAGVARDGGDVAMLVFSDDARPSGEALSAFSAADTAVVPHYYIDQIGTIRQFVDEKRAGQGLGLAIYKQRRHNIDRISVHIRLERPAGYDYSDMQAAALHRLLPGLLARHGLGDADMAMIAADSKGRSRVYAYIPPAPPIEGEGDAFGALGAGMDPNQELWLFLYGETYKPRGGSLKINQAFPLQAAKFNLGAPVGLNDPTPVTVNGRPFNFQPFARDTIFNEGKEYQAVQSLSAILDETNEIPAAGTGRSLLEASYQTALKASAAAGVPLTGNQKLNPGWRFHLVAKNADYGPPLTGNYVAKAGGQDYAFQVFAGETLYTPMSDQAGCLYLSATDPADPAYHDLWRETYKVAKAGYDQNSPFQKKAVELKIGVPLTGPYQASFGGATYTVQVWTLDTLYAGPDGQIKRMSDLPKTADVQAWQPKPPTPPPPTPPNPLPPQVPPTNAGAPRPNDINWPPRPDFDFLKDKGGAREKALGRIEWVRTNGDNIKITNGFAAENIIDIFVPQLAKIQGGQGGKLKFHKVAADQMVRLWAAWEAAGLLHFVKSFAGTWVPRTIRGNPKALSNHAYGTAFDINVPWNGLLKIAAFVGQEGSVRELVPLANAHGFWWGGHWNYDGKGASDGMHFEWAVKR